MSHDYTPEQLRSFYQKLPEEVQEVIFSVETGEKIQSIGKKYNLHIDQVGEVANQVGLLMLGVTKPKQFINEIITDTNVDLETAKKIAQEITEHIFTPIREELKKIHGLNGNKPLTEEIITNNPTISTSNKSDFDDRIGKYLSTNKPSDNITLTPRPYTQDPYREHPN